MIKFETQNEERERRKRQREREWHLYMDEISLLQDKLNTFKQRKVNAQDSIEEQIHFIRVRSILIVYIFFYIEMNSTESRYRIRSISK
jgi:hypothetical protein